MTGTSDLGWMLLYLLLVTALMVAWAYVPA